MENIRKVIKENLLTLFYRGEMHRDGENKKEVEGYGIGMTLANAKVSAEALKALTGEE